MSKLINSVLLLSALLITTATSQNVQMVTVTGIGSDRTAALNSAKRNAIEQGIGVVLSARSITSNFQLLSDNIYTRADGFVKSYKVMKEEKVQPSGEWEVTIEASVTSMLDEVMADQAAVDILLEVMGRPRLMFLIDERVNFPWYSPSSGIVETLLMQAFFEKNFTLVDRQQVAQIRNKDVARQAAAGNVEAVQSLGNMFKAECIVVGQASAVRNAGAYGMASMRADVNAKILRVDTGELLGVANASSTKAQASEEAAARAAFESATQKVAQIIIGHIIRKWGGEAANTTPVFLQVTNVDFIKATYFESWLKEKVAGVRRVTAKPFEGNVAELEVGYEGSANDLAKAIALNTEYPMSVVSVTQNKIVLTCRY